MAESGVHVFDTVAAMHVAAIGAIGAAAAEAIAARGSFTLSLTGGSVARTFYPKLATAGLIEWMRTRVYFGDERCVPPEHEDSNYRLARETLLEHVSVPHDHIFRMRGEDPDLDWAARDYAKSLPERLDLVLLGLGPDGHICSLFPGRPEVREAERLVVPVEGAPKPPPRRLTITPPVVSAARKLLVMVAGADKAGAVASCFSDGPAIDVPGRLAKRGTWIVLRDAAAKLPAQPK